MLNSGWLLYWALSTYSAPIPLEMYDHKYEVNRAACIEEAKYLWRNYRKYPLNDTYFYTYCKFDGDSKSVYVYVKCDEDFNCKTKE